MKSSPAIDGLAGPRATPMIKMKCNLNIEILLKYYPCTYNTLLKVWWDQKLGAACANQKKHTPIPSVRDFIFALGLLIR